jgi:hypothetical protein
MYFGTKITCFLMDFESPGTLDRASFGKISGKKRKN